MKNKKIIFLSLGLLLIVTTLVVSIAAWLTDTATTDPAEFTIGQVKYDLTGDFITTTEPIVPGQELIDQINKFKLTNKSTVKSEIRVKLEVTVGETYYLLPTELSDIFTTTGSSGGGFSLDAGWVYDEGFWYYSDPVVIPASSAEPYDEYSLLSSLKFDGSKVGNDFRNLQVNLKLTFYAKQNEYVTWADLGSIDFTTGI